MNYLLFVKMVRFLKEIYWHLMDFADNTKLHGPRYTSDQARPVYERFVLKILKNKFQVQRVILGSCYKNRLSYNDTFIIL